jgi:hypothetical protein
MEMLLVNMMMYIEWLMKNFHVTQFNRAESVGSEKRLPLPVTKAHTSQSQNVLRSEEEVRLLAEHQDRLCTLGYVTALLCNCVNCLSNRRGWTVLYFVFFVGSR